MKGKRIWSGLLALVFCLGLLPCHCPGGREFYRDKIRWRNSRRK